VSLLKNSFVSVLTPVLGAESPVFGVLSLVQDADLSDGGFFQQAQVFSELRLP
jgi:hypothetical protein